MKHIATMMALTLLGLCATAQTKATIEQGVESKKMTAAYLGSARQVGTYQGLTCWVGKGKGERLVLTLADHNLEPMRTMELPKGAEMRLLASTIDGNRANLLLCDEGYRNMTFVYTASIDLDSMRPADGGAALVVADSIGYGNRDECKVWGAASAGGDHVGFITIVEYHERKQYSASITMLDRSMRRQWSKEYAIGSMDEMAVSDDGTVVTLGYEDEGEMTHFVFNVVSRERANAYDVAVKCDPIRELHLAGLVGRHAMGVGLFRPKDSRPQDNLCGGVVGLSFDINTANLDGFVMRPFQNEDINILDNRKTKKIQREQVMDYVSSNAVCATPFGAVIAVGRNYQRTYNEDNGTTVNDYHRVGLHLVAIDTTAHVKWVRNIRRNDMQKNSDALLGISLMAHDGQTLLIKSECPKYPATYDIAKEAKEFKVDSKNNLVLYAIGDDGEVDKLVLVHKSPRQLLKVGRGADGRLLMLTANGKRTHQTKVSIEHNARH